MAYAQAGVINLTGGGGSGSPVDTLTGNTGGAVPPTANNINVIGDGTTITIAGNPGTSTLTASVIQSGIVYYSLTPYIVGSDVHSQYSTIGAAITAFNLAGVPGNIYVKPGTYTENITLPANCNLIAFGDGIQAITILAGTVTASYAGSSTISGFELQTNSNFAVVISGSNATKLNLNDCYINCTNNTGISYTSSNASSLVVLNDCYTELGANNVTLFVSSSAGMLQFNSCVVNNTAGSTTASTSSVANVTFEGSATAIAFSASGTGNFSFANTFSDCSAINTTVLALTGTGNSNANFTVFRSGTATAITIGAGTTMAMMSCIISSSNTNAISGAGTLSYSFIQFVISSGINVTTKTLLTSTLANSQIFGSQVINAVSTNHAATPYTALATDYYIAVDTSGGVVTVRLPNAPTTNRIFVVKDSNGTAATNNITVTTVGGAVNIDGATTFVMIANYQAINLRFNGTSYEVF